MIATVHVADLGARGTIAALRRRPSPADVPGLRWADAAIAAEPAMNRPPGPRRAALFAFWDDEDAVDRFEASHPLAAPFADGLRARLRPLRAFGEWPGLPPDTTRARQVDHDGPVVVFTLGQLRFSQAIRFLRASRPAERAVRDAPGMRWATAAARPPFVATVSFWADSASTMAYAYGDRDGGHPRAINAQRAKDFHHRSTFVRFAPLRVEGALDGANPAAARTLLG